MTTKDYGLEERTFRFAKLVRSFLNKVPRTIGNVEALKQLARSSASVGANFIEAIESISKKDKIYRMKICRKEAKESKYWLRLIDVQSNSDLLREQESLIQEAQELTHIFGSIVTKSELRT